MKRMNQENTLESYLATLTPESVFFGQIGLGCRNSFYRVFVRAAEGEPWWRLEGSGQPSKIDPLVDLARPDAVTAVFGLLPGLVHYDHHPASSALASLRARASELTATSMTHAERVP